MIDAEWYIENPQGLVDFCVKYKDDNLDVYDITVTDGVSKFNHTRLIRIGGNAFFKDVVHEYMERSKIINIPSTTYLSYRPKANSTERWYRDLSLLLRKYQQSKNFIPNTTPYVWDNNKGKRYNLLLKSEHEKPAGIDPRTVFYLGQTYDCLNINNEAIKYYLERSEMGGYIEEAFMALYRVGKLYEADDWDKASKYYLAAYEKFPSRVEPLVKLAQHYANPQIKYMYAKQACITPQPDHGLFLETGLYEYDRWDQLAIGAWYMPFYKEGYDAVQKALKIKQLPHLLRNKELFEGALGIKKEIINTNNPKIINLVLYSFDEKYDQMKEILIEHNKNHNIRSYFYCYKEDMSIPYEIIDNVLYFSGKETYIPGVLEKTLEAFDIFKDEDYDYIVRSNVSTVVNYKELFKYLPVGEIDYAGPLYYVEHYMNIGAGMNEEKTAKYGKHHFAMGACVVFSKKAIKLLVDNKKDVLSYDLIDDIAIGVYLHDKNLRRRTLSSNSYSFQNSIFKPDIIMYRNKSDDRNTDIVNMRMVVDNLSNKISKINDPNKTNKQIIIVATMTTIPSRIKDIEPVIKSVLSQTVNIKHLEINIPMFCKRTNEEYIIPEWLKNYDKVTIFRTEDYGAITKVAPTLLRYQGIDDVYLWCVDDDFEYHVDHLSLVMIPFDKTKKQIIARYGGELTSEGEIKPWIGGPAEVGYYEGFGSVLYPPNCIKENFQKYLDITSINENCRRADDIVLSIYFRHIGVSMIFHNKPDDKNPYILPGTLPQSRTDALSANGHHENYKIVYKYVKSIINNI